jgi:hypothetical protein
MRANRALFGTAAVLACAAYAITTAAPVPAGRSGLIVHEWGTFSSFSGSDGVPAQFYPNGNDLPAFVYSSARPKKGDSPYLYFAKDEYPAIVSLETPVLYFYTDRPLTASVRADFPAGKFTEWFPQAGRPEAKTLTWSDIRVRPAEAGTPPTRPEPAHYYAARDVDAAPVMVVTKDANREVREHERFLFYRGTGNPKTPLSVAATGGGTFVLRKTGDEPIPAGLLVEVKSGRVRSRELDPLTSSAPLDVTLPAEWTGVEPARACLVAMLVRAGLFEKEARAMVKTWESTWFGDDGTRVLYLLPSGWTDRTLPLKVTPQPDAVMRVMVGRHDVLTPERETEIDALVQQSAGPDGPAKKAADAALAKLGRFQWPAQQQSQKRLALSK